MRVAKALRLVAASSSIALALANGAAAGAATFYTDLASYSAASSNNVAYDFNGSVPAGAFTLVGDGYTRGPVTFNSDGYVFLVSSSFSTYGSDFYSSQLTSFTQLNLSSPATAFSFHYGEITDLESNNPGSAVLFALDDGSTYSTAFPCCGQEGFFGITSSVGISSVTITNYSETDTDIVDFQIGSLASGVPEPVTWGMMLSGFFAVGAARRRRSSQTAVSYT